MNICYSLILICLFVINGAIITLVLKWQNNSIFLGKAFVHPVLQNIFIYIGMILSYPLYLIAFRKPPYAPYKQKLILAIPGVLDAATSMLLSFGLILVSASIYQMVRSSILIFIVIFSLIIIGRKPTAIHIVGVVILIVSISLTGVSQILFSESKQKSKMAFIGIMLILVSQIVSGLSIVLEEKYITSIDIHPTEACGVEGIFGMAATCLILLPIFSNIKCEISDYCPYGTMESIILGIKQTFSSWTAGMQLLLVIVSVNLFNIAGIFINKYQGATTRTVLDCVRMVLIWAVSLGVKWEKFNWLHFSGLIGIIIGVLTYNGIFCLCCKKQQEKHQEARNESYGTYVEAQSGEGVGTDP